MEELDWKKEYMENHNNEVILSHEDKLSEESKRILAEAGMSLEEFSKVCERIAEAFRAATIPVVEACNNLAKFLAEVFKVHESNKVQVTEAIGLGLVPPSLWNLAFEHRKFRIRNKNVNRAIRELRIAKKRKEK